MKFPYNSIFFLKSVPLESYKTLLKNKDKPIEDTLIQKKKVIICAFCGNTITDVSKIISINGSHQHVFVNPYGIIFETGCFKQCDGCVVDPTASNEFSWFHGYSWQVVGCSMCRQHLGWLFSRDNNSKSSGLIESSKEKSNYKQDSFYCLILKNIIMPK